MSDRGGASRRTSAWVGSQNANPLAVRAADNRRSSPLAAAGRGMPRSPGSARSVGSAPAIQEESNEVEAGEFKVENLQDARPASDGDVEEILTALQGKGSNPERLEAVQELKVPYLFSTAQIESIMQVTESVKTRIAIMQHLGPRAVNPREKAAIVGMFRFSEDKRQVEDILKAREQLLSSMRMAAPSTVSSPVSLGVGGGRGRGRGRGRGAGAGRGAGGRTTAGRRPVSMPVTTASSTSSTAAAATKRVSADATTTASCGESTPASASSSSKPTDSSAAADSSAPADPDTGASATTEPAPAKPTTDSTTVASDSAEQTSASSPTDPSADAASATPATTPSAVQDDAKPATSNPATAKSSEPKAATASTSKASPTKSPKPAATAAVTATATAVATATAKPPQTATAPTPTAKPDAPTTASGGNSSPAPAPTPAPEAKAAATEPGPRTPIVPGPNGERVVLSYEELVDRNARKDLEGLEVTKLEEYLSESEFLTHFNMNKNAFYTLPKWRRDERKKSLRLF